MDLASSFLIIQHTRAQDEHLPKKYRMIQDLEEPVPHTRKAKLDT